MDCLHLSMQSDVDSSIWGSSQGTSSLTGGETVYTFQPHSDNSNKGMDPDRVCNITWSIGSMTKAWLEFCLNHNQFLWLTVTGYDITQKLLQIGVCGGTDKGGITRATEERKTKVNV